MQAVKCFGFRQNIKKSLDFGLKKIAGITNVLTMLLGTYAELSFIIQTIISLFSLSF